MKRLTYLVAVLLLASFNLQAQWGPILSASRSSGTSYTQRYQTTGSTYDNTAINLNAGRTYAASNFTTAAAYTITKVDVPLYKNNSPVFKVKCAIYTDNAGVPGTLVGTASDEVDASTCPSSESTMTSFVNLSATVSSGTIYWIVIYKSSGTNSYSVDFLRWPYVNNGGGTPYVMDVSQDTTSWSVDSIGGFNMPGKATVYSSP